MSHGRRRLLQVGKQAVRHAGLKSLRSCRVLSGASSRAGLVEGGKVERDQASH